MTCWWPLDRKAFMIETVIVICVHGADARVCWHVLLPKYAFGGNAKVSIPRDVSRSHGTREVEDSGLKPIF